MRSELDQVLFEDIRDINKSDWFSNDEVLEAVEIGPKRNSVLEASSDDGFTDDELTKYGISAEDLEAIDGMDDDEDEFYDDVLDELYQKVKEAGTVTHFYIFRTVKINLCERLFCVVEGIKISLLVGKVGVGSQITKLDFSLFGKRVFCRNKDVQGSCKKRLKVQIVFFNELGNYILVA